MGGGDLGAARRVRLTPHARFGKGEGVDGKGPGDRNLAGDLLHGHVRFGKGPTEKDPNHGHLAGGLLHVTLRSVGAGGCDFPRPPDRL